MPQSGDPLRSSQHRELMQTASRAALALAGRSREIEAHRALPPDVADALADAGLYRLLTPQACGGHEAPPASFVLVIEQLARADAAAAWCCFISCTASVLAAYLPETEAADLFGQPQLKAAGVFAPRGRAVPAEQNGLPGYRVTGRWSWGSGAPNADLITAGCLVMGDDGQAQLLADGSPRVLSVVLDRSQVHVLNNWDSMGLCGTGSGEFEVKDAFVPGAHAASLFDGPRLNTPLYRFPVFGTEQAARTVPQASSKPLATKATVQEAVARAEAQLQGARAFMLASIDAAWQAALQGHELPVACRRDIRLAATHAVHTSAEVVNRLYTLAGGGAVFAESPLQRCLRNIHVATQHMMVSEATYELTGRLLLGQPTQTNML
jgi:alkylation response protein AidB-like acyl-CoA dehydrogenase